MRPAPILLWLTIAITACGFDTTEGGGGTEASTETEDGSSSTTDMADSGYGGTTAGPCMPGTEGCGCYQGECFGDLTCASDLCVDLGGGSGDADGTSGSTSGATSTSTTSADDTGETSGSIPDPGTQPGSGMYAHCLQHSQCPVGMYCQLFYNHQNVIDNGFCTNSNCTVPASASCSPSPGDTTEPICVFNQGAGIYHCALDCSQGPCPAGCSATSTLRFRSADEDHQRQPVPSGTRPSCR